MSARADADAIVKALGGRWHGDSASASCRCPAHDDREPSLSVGVSNGMVLVHCHAGCSQAAVIDALKAKGVWPNGERDERRPAGARKARTGEKRAEPKAKRAAVIRTRVFEYRDEAGKVLFEVVREELAGGGKQIHQRRTDARGRTVHNLEGVRLVPYRLPELIVAIDTGQTIYVAEGEAKVSLLTTWGLASTCNPMGAGKWRPEYAEPFKRRRVPVVVLPDHDAAGEKHARQVAESLVPLAESVKVIDLPRLGPGEDVIDFAARGGTKELLLALVEAALLWDPAAAVPHIDDSDHQQATSEIGRESEAAGTNAEEAAIAAQPQPEDVAGEDAESADAAGPEPEGEPDERPADVRPLWKEHLIYGDTGPKKVLANAIVAFRQAPQWRGVLGFNEFAQRVIVRGPPPWERGEGDRDEKWTSTDDARAADWLQCNGIYVGPDVVAQAVDVVARDHLVHPIREYLDGLHWDGHPRLDLWATVHLGTPDTLYARAVASRWMISAVARIYRPGVKADHCLILEGPQGILKSTALKVMAEPWFTDEVAELGTKDAAIQLLGAWVIELAELDSMRRAEVSRVNAFLVRTTDRFRPPYGRRVAEFPRQCVFAGTVNHSEYLRDETGGRRFWSIPCGRIDVDGLAAARDQLWAEARARFLADEPWWLDTSDLTRAAREEQEARRQPDPWEDAVADFALDKTSVSVLEILAHLGLKVGEWTQPDENRVARCLKGTGWERYRVGSGPERGKWRYRRAEASPAAQIKD